MIHNDGLLTPQGHNPAGRHRPPRPSSTEPDAAPPPLRRFSRTEGPEMTSTLPSHTLDSIVIGGGQAGLAIAYYLSRQGADFVVLDAAAETGESWRTRWDSLRLFTPAEYDGLPGMQFPAADG